MPRVLLGLDLGTTSLIGRLWEPDGQVVAEASCANPQQEYGAEVISRLQAATTGHAGRLQALLVEGINSLLTELLKQSDRQREEVCAAATAANPAISLLLTGRSGEELLRPPYRPDYLAGEQLASEELGLELPVPLYLLPLRSGYIGGDLLALLFGNPPGDEPAMYIDLGTNAELALWDGDRWLATSVAAGPAFEAGNLSCGMLYGCGAVSEVAIIKDRFVQTVVGGGLPKGICGSGLFSLLGCAVQSGLIATDGRIKSAAEIDSGLSRYLVEDAGAQVLQLYRDARTRLQLTQEDVRAFQLAKGAVLAGVTCLLERRGLAAEKLARVYIAGALGGALPQAALKGVALLPEIVLEKCRFLPDAVLHGLRKILQLEDGADQVEKLASALKPYPLSGTPAFEKAFLASLDF